MVRARRPHKRLLERIAGLREPLDVLTTHGTVLVERLRHVPLRGTRLLARSAEQLVAAGKEITHCWRRSRRRPAPTCRLRANACPTYVRSRKRSRSSYARPSSESEEA